MGESPFRSSVTFTASIFLASTSTGACIFTDLRQTFYFCLSHFPLVVLLEADRIDCKPDRVVAVRNRGSVVVRPDIRRIHLPEMAP